MPEEAIDILDHLANKLKAQLDEWCEDGWEPEAGVNAKFAIIAKLHGKVRKEYLNRTVEVLESRMPYNS